MSKYDVTVIGSGPGGYIAAIRCAQLGMKTAIVERYSALGGTCGNVGCIPSKALLDSSEHFHNAESKFEAHGINLKDLKVDWKQMVKRKDEVVKGNSDGVQYLMKKNKIDLINGHATFKSKNEIEIRKDDDSTETIETEKAIIATGSKPASLPDIEIDKKRIISSTEALSLSEIPKELLIVGGGYIGLEMGSVFARLGSKVSVVEYMERIIPAMDKDLARELQKSLKKLGIEFYLKHKVEEVSVKGKKVTLKAKGKKDEDVELKGDYCLMAVGRKPYTENLGLDNIDVKTNDKGFIEVDDNLQTAQSGIYAIGDVIQKGPMLAHKAEEEGVFVAELMAGEKPHMNYNLIPGVVYTWPEVAAVGKTEEQLKDESVKYKSGKFPFKASGRARASMDEEGMIKVLSEEETDEILGVHMIGPRAADMIAEAVVAMEYRASAEDIGRICHAHPTFSEAFKEAALDASDSRALNL